MTRITIILLLLIIIGGSLLRLLWLDSFPPGVTGDEIQQGYTALSLLKTGKDEWGDFLPINPRGFGDYKPPLYVYLTVPSVALFGLNIFSVRLPSAILSIFCILLIYLVSQELFNSRKISLWTAFFLAISAWHWQFSRIAWESNIGCFFFLLGLWGFLKGLKKPQYLYLSAIGFGLTLFTYHSFKVFVILFLVSLLGLFWKKIIKINRQSLIGALVLLGIFIGTMFYGYIFSGAGRRAADAAVYNEENLLALRNLQVEDDLPNPFNRIINNKMGYVTSQFIQNYFGYFSTTFLVSPHRSDFSLFNLPGQWLFSTIEFLLALIGIVTVFVKRMPFKNMLVAWVLLAPLPAALTREYMHTQRVEVLLLIFPIFIGIGAYTIWSLLRNTKLKAFFPFLLVGLMMVNLVGRIDFYLFHFFNLKMGGHIYGYNEVIAYTEENKDKYDQILFTKEYSEPQAFVAFYTNMDPTVYQSYSKDWKSFEENGFRFLDMTNYKLEKYYFKSIEWDKDKLVKNTLIVTPSKDIPSEVQKKAKKIIKNPKGEVLFVVLDTNEI